MQGEPLFLGIYAKSDEAEAGGGQKVPRWHAWGLPDGSFLVQKILTDERGATLTPPKPLHISSDDFFAGFRVFAAFSARHNPTFPRERTEWVDQTPEKDKTPVRPSQTGTARERVPLLEQAQSRPGATSEHYQPQAKTGQGAASAHGMQAQARQGAAGAYSGQARTGQGAAGAHGGQAQTGQPHTGPDAAKTNADTWQQSGSPERRAPIDSGPLSFVDFLAMSNAEEAQAEEEARLEAAENTGAAQDSGQNNNQAENQSSNQGNTQNSNQGSNQSGKYVIVKGAGGETADKEAYRFRSFSLEADEPPDGGPVEMSSEESAKIEGDFRADFSMSIIKLNDKRNDALQSLQALAANPGPFARDHKFMFTDCGLALRKRNLYALAELFHKRARALAPQDEHVLFNLARVMYESGKVAKAREYLDLALEINPDFEAGREFLSFVDGARARSK